MVGSNVSIETGQQIIKTQSKFHEQITLIRNDLNKSEHPISKIIAVFKSSFFGRYIKYLKKQNPDEYYEEA